MRRSIRTRSSRVCTENAARSSKMCANCLNACNIQVSAEQSNDLRCQLDIPVHPLRWMCCLLERRICNRLVLDSPPPTPQRPSATRRRERGPISNLKRSSNYIWTDATMCTIYSLLHYVKQLFIFRRRRKFEINVKFQRRTKRIIRFNEFHCQSGTTLINDNQAMLSFLAYSQLSAESGRW